MTDSTQALDTVTTLKELGYSGPLYANLDHPLFDYEQSWREKKLLMSREMAVPTDRDGWFISVEDATLRSTNAITNQHGAIMIDSDIEFELVRGDLIGDFTFDQSIQVRVTRTDRALAGPIRVTRENVRRIYFSRSTLDDTPYSFVYWVGTSPASKKVAVSDTSDAFIRHVEGRMTNRAKFPVAMTPGGSLKLRFPLSQEPFFYALNSSEFDKVAGLVSESDKSMSRSFNFNSLPGGKIFEDAFDNVNKVLGITPEIQVVRFEDGSRTCRLGRKLHEASSTLLNVRSTSHRDTYAWQMPNYTDTLRGETSARINTSLFDLVMDFLFSGVRAIPVQRDNLHKLDRQFPVFVERV